VATIETLLSTLLLVFGVAAVARYVAAARPWLPYTIVLVLAGVSVAALGIDLQIELTHDLILFVIIPTILFFGALQLDIEIFRQHLPWIALLVVVGLPAAVGLMGFVTWSLLPFPLIIALILASMLYPLDPVAVLSVFKEMDADERLVGIIEGETLFDDGVAVVLFSTFLALFQDGHRTDEELLAFLTPGQPGTIGIDLVVVSIGGLLVGAAAGYVVYRLRRHAVDDHLTGLLLTILAAYGSMLLAEHYLHVSGVLATVTAGIVVGVTDDSAHISDEIGGFIESVWDEGEFLANTIVYLLIGSQVHITHFIQHADLIVFGTIIVLLARAVVVYALTVVANRLLADPIPLDYQHVLVWGALHTVIPIALVLGLPADIPYHEALRTTVFGVAIVSIVIQGLLLPDVLNATGVAADDGWAASHTA
jgi:CPA1 family monovalent cation:H+ antiporter